MLSLKRQLVVALSFFAGVYSQRPSNTSICDYYTTALLKDNSAANQYTLLTLLVNTVVIGNYTKPNVGVAVPGILAKGTVNGTEVNLLPYFNGMLLSSNRGGNAGVAINFLDDGGAAPLKMNMPANGKSSNQYKLLTHLYQFFGSLLGCSQYGMGAFPPYDGQRSMGKVHRFMDLNNAEVTYFITQVGLAAASFGVAQSDITAVAQALVKLFGYRCSPPTTVIKAQGPDLQSICQDSNTCPLDPNATCAAYPMEMRAMAANSTQSNMTASLSMSMTPTMTAPAQQTTNAGYKSNALGVAGLGLAGAIVALAL